MNKPITVARQEFIDGLIRYINESPLPSFVVAETLTAILPVVEANAQKEYETDVTGYYQAIQTSQAQQQADGKKSTKKRTVKESDKKDH